MAGNPNVSTRISYLRKEARRILGEKFGVTAEWLMQQHHEILTTPIEEVTESHPLAQEVKKERRTDGRREDAEEYEVLTVKMPAKMDALKELAKLGGFYEAEKKEVVVTVHQDVEDALSKILPT